MTSTTSGSTNTCGRPWSTVSSQSTYAKNMPIAPWAKLKTPGGRVDDDQPARGHRDDARERQGEDDEVRSGSSR